MMHRWQPSFNLHPNKAEEQREVRERSFIFKNCEKQRRLGSKEINIFFLIRFKYDGLNFGDFTSLKYYVTVQKIVPD